jgi:GT2 family glycosyltransferase
LSSNDTYPQHVVTAVIVAHDGAAWLPRVIGSLLDQSRPVQRVVAVDTGSRDRSGSVLASLLGQAVVFGMDRTTGYGAAVTRALQHRAANVNVPGSSALSATGSVEWVWLLHDDSEPAHDALEQLLRGAVETRSAGVLGPKVRDWADHQVILEAGVAIDTAGRRITGIEPREVDQGQHDGDRDCLAVGSAGMLIRRDVWDSVGGFDTDMALFREDVDFCWRVHEAGHRVRLITDAVVYHVEASARRRRPVSVARRPRRLDRRNAMLTLIGNLPALPMLASAAGNLTVSLLRAVFFLLAKRLSAAMDELGAVASVFGHPLRLLALRRRRMRGRRAAYGRLRRELPPGRSLRRIAEFAAAALSKSAQADTAGTHHATDDPDEADYLLTDTGLVQRILTSPGVLLFIALTVISLVAERSLLGPGPLGGGALIPAWGGAAGLWREYLQGFHPVGVGSGSSTPPYLAVIAALATVLGGKPWLAVDVILLGCVPLAGISAFLAVRRVTRSTPVRLWAAASYALLPVAMGAIAAGRIGTAVVFVLIPVIALLAGRMLTLPPRRARRAAWAAGLTIAVAAAFVPLVWVVALVAALALVAARPGMWRNLGIVVAVPPLLLLPWTVQVATNPAALLLEVGLQQPGLAVHDLSARSLLLLSPGGPGLPSMWVTAGIAVAALAALLLSRRRALMMAGWSIALAGLLVAVAVSRVVVTPGGGEPAVAAWPGAAMLIAAVGLLLAGATAGEDIPRLVHGPGNRDLDDRPAPGGGKKRFKRDGGRKGGHPAGGRGPRALRGIGVAALAVVACSAPVLAAASWVTSGVRGPVGPVSGPIVPAVVSASASNGLQQRTLVLREAGSQVSYSLQRGASPSLGDADLTPVPAAQRALSTAVAALVAPNGGEAVNQGQLLSQLDIGFVLLPSPVNQNLARLMSGIAGLQQMSYSSAFALWRVTGLTARVRVVEPSGTVVALPSGQLGVSGAQAPAAGGTVELAEPAGGWHATLNGQPLTPVASPAGGWAAAFRLPAGGGVLGIGHDQTGRDLILIFELLAVAVVAGLGLPGSRATAEESASAAAGSRARSGPVKGVGEVGGAPSLAGGAGQTDDAAEPEDAGVPSGPGGRRSRGRVAARGGRGGARRDRDAAPRRRRGRRPAAEKPVGAPARRRSGAGSVPGAGPAVPGAGFPAGGPPRPRAPRPEDEPAVPGAGWAADEGRGAGWAADEGRGAGWAAGEDAGAAWSAGEGPGAAWSAGEGPGAGWAAGEDAGAGWQADQPADQQWGAGAPAGQSAGWPEDEQAGWPSDDLASPGAGWPAGQRAGWPEGGQAGWPEGGQAGWPSDQLAGPGTGRPSAEPGGWPATERSEPAGGPPQVAPPRSPSGTWPPPDQTERWSHQPGWPAPDPSGWSPGRTEMLDPLPPGRGSRHRRPESDDDEGAPGWPIPERDWRGDAW